MQFLIRFDQNVLQRELYANSEKSSSVKPSDDSIKSNFKVNQSGDCNGTKEGLVALSMGVN